MEILLKVLAVIAFISIYGYGTKVMLSPGKTLHKGYDVETGRKFKIVQERQARKLRVKDGWRYKELRTSEVFTFLPEQIRREMKQFSDAQDAKAKQEREDKESWESMAYRDMDEEQHFYERTGAGGFNQWHLAIDKQRKEYTGEDD